MTWACLRVQPRREREAATLLRSKGVTAYTPTEVRKIEVRTKHVRRHVPRTSALIPSYVFALVETEADIDAINSVRTVREIMADRNGKPKTVDLAKLRGLFLAELFKCFDATWEAEKPKGYVPRWKKGDHVRGKGGFMDGWLGVVLAHRRGQSIEVMFTMFGKETPVVLKEDAVRAMEAA